MRWTPAARLLLAITLPACTPPSPGSQPGADASVDGSGDDATASGSLEGEPRICPDLPAAPVVDDAPIFVYYGAYHLADYPDDINWPATLALRGAKPGVQDVLVTNPPDPCARFRPWLEAGGQLAFKMARSRALAGDASLEALLDAGTAADAIRARLDQGYSYVAIDELSWAFGPERWVDGGDLADRFAGLLDELAAMGLDRRVILYVNTYNNAGRLGRFSRVLRACHQHCRVIASEVYMHIANVLASNAGVVRAQTDPSCTYNLGCLDRLAREMDAVSPGINQRAITVIRLDDEGYNDGRLESLCASFTQLDHAGGLDIEYGRIHFGTYTRQQPGIGGYTPARVGRHPNWGAIHQAACLHNLNAWW